jgi:hypothetical protein
VFRTKYTWIFSVKSIFLNEKKRSIEKTNARERKEHRKQKKGDKTENGRTEIQRVEKKK